MLDISEPSSNDPRELDSDKRRLLQLLLEAEKRRRRFNDFIPVHLTRGSSVPASFAQERLWYLDQVGLVGAAYNVPLVIRLFSEIHESSLQDSFREVIRRHESLRTTFTQKDGVPHQTIAPSLYF